MSASSYIVVTFKFQKLDGRWTAYCEELGTATFGRSLPEAEKRIKEAVTLHLNTLEDVGERERFFQENNIVFHEYEPKENVTICLPLERETFMSSQVMEIPSLA